MCQKELKYCNVGEKIDKTEGAKNYCRISLQQKQKYGVVYVL